MILQALTNYYDRVRSMPGAKIIEPGYAMSGAAAELVIDKHGNLIAVSPLTVQQGKKRVPQSMIVPLPPKRSGQRPEASFLYETVAFLFGIYDKPEGAKYRFEASKHAHRAVLEGVDDDGARAVLSFFEKRTLGQIEYPGVDTALLKDERLFVVFRLQGDKLYLHERPAIRAAWAEFVGRRTLDAPIAQCLVTGEMAPLARLHGNISGFGADKPTLVGFNQDSFRSYGKEQGANAPVSEQAAFEYVTALNMLVKDRNHFVNLTGDKVLFWAERDAAQEESLLSFLFGGASVEDERLDADQRDRIRGILGGIMRGGNPRDYALDPDVKFYLLGLAANKTRLVIRFFYVNEFGKLLDNLIAHYRDIAIVGSRIPYPSPYRLLLESALKREAGNVPPNLDAALMDSIMNNRHYPWMLYQAILRRIRADGEVTSLRAGLIKGTLNRLENKEVLTMALDPHQRDTAYLLGRLFALYERSQAEALGDVNSSIADKYFNAALASPQMVFVTLTELNKKHLNKIENGARAHYLLRQITEVFSMLELMPSQGGSFLFPETLNANDQGKFIGGYYHQMQAFFTKREKPAAETESKSTEDNEEA